MQLAGPFTFWHVDLVPRPEIEPRPPALGTWSLSLWTTRKVPGSMFSLWAAPGGPVSQLKLQHTGLIHSVENDFKPFVCIESEAVSPRWGRAWRDPWGFSSLQITSGVCQGVRAG